MKKYLLMIATLFFLSNMTSGQGLFTGTIVANGTLQSVVWSDVTFADADGIPDADDAVELTVDNNAALINVSSIADFDCESFKFKLLGAVNPVTFFVLLGSTFSSATTIDCNNSTIFTFNIFAASVVDIGGDFINTTGVGFSFVGGTVEYTGNLAQNVMKGNYGNLTFTGTGNKKITASGLESITAGTFIANTSTVEFSSTAIDQSLPILGDYYNVVLSNEDKILHASLVVTNDLTINSGIDLNAILRNISIGRDFIINGTYSSSGSEEVEFIGSSASTVSGIATTINKLVINKTNSGDVVTLSIGITIPSDGSVVVTRGTLASGGNLTLKSSSAIATARVEEINTADASITGDVVVERFIPSESTTGRFWWHIGSPVNSLAVTDIQDNFNVTGSFTGANTFVGSQNRQSMRTYDETNTSTAIEDGWLDFPAIANTETMSLGKGYRVFIRDNTSATVANQTLDMTGTLQQGDFNFNPTFTSSGTAVSDGWNFVSNPYASPIDWGDNLSWTKTNLETIAYVWDAKNKTYRTVNNSSGKIPFGQGFWIQANAASPVLTITESAKLSNNQAFSRPTAVVEENLVEISLKNESSSDPTSTAITYLQFDNLASLGKDEKDANQLGRNFTFDGWEKTFAVLVDIASQADGDYSFRKNVLPLSETIEEIPLSIVYGEGTDYGFEFHKQNFLSATADLVLKDKYLNTETSLQDHDYVSFVTDANLASKASDRFSILVSAKPLSVFGTNNETSHSSVYPNPVNDKFTIIATASTTGTKLVLTNTSGVQVLNKTISSVGSFEEVIDVNDLESGIYLLSVVSGYSVETHKIIVE